MYHITKKLDLPFDTAVKRLRELFSTEGFELKLEIDMKEIFSSKLDYDFDDYVIFGVSNPKLAYRALQSEKQSGLFIPINIILYTEDDSTFISITKPTEQMFLVEHPELRELAIEGEERLKRIMNRLDSSD